MNLYLVPDYQLQLEGASNAVPNLDMLKNKRILITGARGMVGSFLVDLLCYCADKKGLGCQVYAAGRNKKLLSERFSPHCQKKYLSFLVSESGIPSVLEYEKVKVPDYVIHCAGDGSPANFMGAPEKMVRDSVAGIYDVLKYAGRSSVASMLLVSTGEVYGQPIPGAEGISEQGFEESYLGWTDNLPPRSCYPLSRRVQENMWVSYGPRHGIAATVARLSHIYGPTALSSENRIAGVCLRAASRREPIVLNSPGRQKRSWCYVADCGTGILNILLSGKTGEAYNVASEDAYTIAEFAQMAADAGGSGLIFNWDSGDIQAAANPMDMAVLSADKLKKLGWKQQYSLEKGIEVTLRCLRMMEGECNGIS